MRIDSPGWLTDLALLELQGAAITDCGDHYVIRSDANPTFWWGNFLLLEYAPVESEIDHWLDRFEVEFPDAAHRTFGIVEVDVDSTGWVRRGFEVGVDVVLSAPPRAVAAIGQGWPAEVEIRELASTDDWEQLARLGAAGVAAGELEARMAFEDRRAAAQRGLVEAGHGVWFGAFAAGRLVSKLGMVRVGQLARYQDVVTDPAHRRRGLAGALVQRAASWAAEQSGITQLVIVAEEDGPAIGLYRGLGLVEVARQVGVEKAT